MHRAALVKVFTVTDGARVPVSKIDWNGRAPAFGPMKEMDWVEEWGRSKPQEKSLAERTGLNVRVER